MAKAKNKKVLENEGYEDCPVCGTLILGGDVCYRCGIDADERDAQEDVYAQTDKMFRDALALEAAQDAAREDIARERDRAQDEALRDDEYDLRGDGMDDIERANYELMARLGDEEENKDRAYRKAIEESVDEALGIRPVII